jgi:hypothetical protein
VSAAQRLGQSHALVMAGADAIRAVAMKPARPVMGTSVTAYPAAMPVHPASIEEAVPVCARRRHDQIAVVRF